MWATNTDFDAGGAGNRVDFASGQLLGVVRRLDRTTVVVGSESVHAAHVTVSNLVALGYDDDRLIGMVESVEASSGSSDGGLELRIAPVGTYQEGPDGARFVRGATAFPHVGDECRLISGETLRAFMAVLTDEVDAGERLVLGTYVDNEGAVAVADGNRLFQRHLALLGSTGAGKSWAVASILERAAELGHANLIVFDLHGEYGPLTESVNGAEPIARGLRVAGPNDVAAGDSEANEDLLYLPYWLLSRDELMSFVLNASDPNAPDQLLRFTEHVQTLKQISLIEAGREDAGTRFTVDSPIPYRLENLLRMMREDNTERVPQHPSGTLNPGPYFGLLTGLITRIESRAIDPRFSFIFNPPEHTLSYEWLTETASTLLEASGDGPGIKIIDLSEVPSSVLPVVVGAIARFIYDVQFWMDPDVRGPVCLVCDEAHLYLPSREDSLPIHRTPVTTFESISKEGRKYGVSLVVVSQRPTDVSRTILSQCNNLIVMRLANERDQSMIEALMPESAPGVRGALPVLEVGEAVVIGDALPLTSRVRFDAPEIKPTSTTQRYWSLWRDKASSTTGIEAGVEALRATARRPDPRFALSVACGPSSRVRCDDECGSAAIRARRGTLPVPARRGPLGL